VSVGDRVAEGDTLIVLESDKASMEIPSPVAGVIERLSVKDGDQVKQGDPIASVAAEALSAPASPASDSASRSSVVSEAPAKPAQQAAPASPKELIKTPVGVHAGPAVRALARELGVDLAQLTGSGPKGRITKDDLHQFVKTQLANRSTSGPGAHGGTGIPSVPMVDFEAFGPIERRPMSKIHRLTADNMTRCLLNVPAVTQFDEADITELEAFRKSMKAEAEQRAVRLTPLPFLIKACAYALKALPQVNASIDVESEEIIVKQYVHIGIAVDTPDGLMVPVLRDADQKGLWELARRGF
jgi:Pyruvate/2-oxoglutarate dehydrogenase complex, dihydrolipoamide acyltransferase (E2) component, and related enzymes